MTKQELLNMNKAQLISERNSLIAQVAQIDQRLSNMEKVLKLKDIDKPFQKWSLAEMNDLYSINNKAFEWFGQNKDKTVYDYNAQAYEEDRINLE